MNQIQTKQHMLLLQIRGQTEVMPFLLSTSTGHIGIKAIFDIAFLFVFQVIDIKKDISIQKNLRHESEAFYIFYCGFFLDALQCPA